MSYAPPNWLFTVFSMLGFVLCMVPLPWHLEAWNTGTVMFMLWVGLGCLGFSINSIVWNSNVVDWAPVWCDIWTHYEIGLSVAIPACMLCISRRMYSIASSNSVVVATKAEKRRGVAIDLAISLGIPLVQMALQYIVSGYRYQIFEDFGCSDFTENNVLYYPLVAMWPVIIGVASFVYSVLNILAFNKRRAQFKELMSTKRNLNSARYMRLIIISFVDVGLTVPLAVTQIVLSATQTVYSWVSLEYIHYGWSTIPQKLAIQWRSSPALETQIELTRWLCVLCALVFFAFFGVAEEARMHYSLAWKWVSSKAGSSTRSLRSTFGFSTNSQSSGNTGRSKPDLNRGPILPVYVKPKPMGGLSDTDLFTDTKPSDSDSESFVAYEKGDPILSAGEETQGFQDTIGSAGKIITLSDGDVIMSYSGGDFTVTGTRMSTISALTSVYEEDIAETLERMSRSYPSNGNHSRPASRAHTLPDKDWPRM